MLVLLHLLASQLPAVAVQRVMWHRAPFTPHVQSPDTSGWVDVAARLAFWTLSLSLAIRAFVVFSLLIHGSHSLTLSVWPSSIPSLFLFAGAGTGRLLTRLDAHRPRSSSAAGLASLVVWHENLSCLKCIGLLVVDTAQALFR